MDTCAEEIKVRVILELNILLRVNASTTSFIALSLKDVMGKNIWKREKNGWNEGNWNELILKTFRIFPKNQRKFVHLFLV